MKSMEMVLVFCMGAAIGSWAMYSVTPKAAIAPPAPERPQVASGDVTDLIERLKPLAERPNEDWHGVSVTITGASAKVEIKTKDGNEYSGKGKSLPDAVRMIDSLKIRDALQGWGDQRVAK